MTRVAAIDMGTNSTRLLVADVDGPGRDAKLVVLERRTKITRLGQGVDKDRTLHPDAIERSLAVLRDYRAVIDELGVERVRASATSAARDASNRDELFDPAERILGARPELLAGEEEARLEFVDEPEGLCSIDIGCVRLTEQFLHSDPPTAEELSQAVSVVRDEVAEVGRRLPGAKLAPTLVGTAGTVWTLAAIELGVDPERSDLIDHFRLTRAAAEDVFRTLATEPVEQRRHNPGLDPGRVDVIVGGAIVVVGVLRHFGFDSLLVSEADILDGLVRDSA